MGKGKVVYVDFGKGKKPSAGGFGGGPRLLFALFAAVLSLELLVAAAAYPHAITSPFFGPTVIAVAVICTLALRRAIARVQVARLYKKTMHRPDQEPKEPPGRWLH